MRMSGIELQSCTAGRWHGAPPAVIEGITTDTRRLSRGDAFVALRGANFDGHAFAAEAARRGAAALIGDKDGVSAWQGIALPQLEVRDSLRALGDIAAQWRCGLKLPLVAITGSYGKTTLRSMLEHILLSKGFRLTATRSNDNNLIGVPQTLLRIRPDDDVAVIECGISEPGEMLRLAAMVRPDVAVITGITAAHAEGLGSLAGVAAEKALLFDMLAEGGCAVLGHGVAAVLGKRALPAGRTMLDMDVQGGQTVQWSLHGRRVTLSLGAQCCAFDIALPAEHWAQDVSLAASILLHLGLATLAEIGEAMGGWQPVGGRMRRLSGIGGCTLLDDSYNANPVSMQAALDTLRRLPGRRIAVLGSMAELGRDSAFLHAGLNVGGLDAVLLFGEEMRALAVRHPEAMHEDSIEQVVQRLRAMQPGNGDTVLIKGSRCMRMERVVNALAEAGDAV
jgi:UDP-N-acetylmuramoyl-tripeptide--D-alanyl-D-alanine ligase